MWRCAVLLLALPSFAQTLSWERARALAVESSPVVALNAARAEQARTEIGVAGMVPNPKLTLGTTLATQLFTSSLQVAIPAFGQRGIAMDAAGAAAKVMRLGVDVAQLDARWAASDAWLLVWLVRREQAAATETAARREQLLVSARSRFSEGAGARLDVVRTEAEAARTRAEVEALGAQVTAARARLTALLGVGGLDIEDGPPAATEPPAELDLPEAHPALLRAKQLVTAGEASVMREERNRWPLLYVTISGAFFDRTPPPQHDASLSIAAEIPVFNQALVERARATTEASRRELAMVRIQLDGQLGAAIAEDRAARAREKVQLERVLPAAQEAASLAQEAYRSGRLDLTAALLAEQSYADAQLTAVRSSADRARARATLEHALGHAL